ncbi:hypothetical protein RJ639_010684 [Escallonia herrerae]|uniref:BED-type domain-containing protein n=1 Tax=Escallonia herrerae TaxID=1293975 RepID=A0AA89ATV5_9ASTE|nr:hypothetical protein RJ639_010684 [Escallonia herrerae]
MSRAKDIGWQHGKMVGGCRHRVQCNYCHTIMIGGITRFKKHIACKRGEIRSCDAVPKEVMETIRKHLAATTMRKPRGKKQPKIDVEASLLLSSEDKDTDSDEPDREIAATRLEELRTLNEAESSHQPLVVTVIARFWGNIDVLRTGNRTETEPLMEESQDIFDALLANHHKDDQVS